MRVDVHAPLNHIATTYDVGRELQRSMEANLGFHEKRIMEERSNSTGLVTTRVQSHVKLGFVGQILVKGAIAYQTTEVYEDEESARAAVNKRVGERLASLFE